MGSGSVAAERKLSAQHFCNYNLQHRTIGTRRIAGNACGQIEDLPDTSGHRQHPNKNSSPPGVRLNLLYHIMEYHSTHKNTHKNNNSSLSPARRFSKIRTESRFQIKIVYECYLYDQSIDVYDQHIEL